MFISVPRSRRALIVGGVAAAVTLGGAGFAYAATTTAAPTSSAPTAASSTAAGKHKHVLPEDLLTAVTGTSITVDTPRGPKTFTLTPTTTYHRGKTPLTAADLKAGEMVRIRVGKAAAGSPTAKAVTIAPAVVTGYVQSHSGSVLTVIDESGFTRTVNTTGGTTYRKNGAAGSASDVTDGSLIHAQGPINSDGTSIDATTIGVRHP